MKKNPNENYEKDQELEELEEEQDYEVEDYEIEDEDFEDEEYDYDHEDEYDIIYLTLDDDTELECSVLGIFDVEDEEYIALVPLGEEEVLLYKFIEDDEDFELMNIEDDEEFELVSEAFELLFGEDYEE